MKILIGVVSQVQINVFHSELYSKNLLQMPQPSKLARFSLQASCTIVLKYVIKPRNLLKDWSPVRVTT